MKKYLILISFFLLTACQWNDAGLGNHYYYLNPDEAVDVGYPGGAIIYKSAQEYSYSDVKVRGNVIKVHFNERFIVALQKPLEKKTDTIRYFLINKTNDRVYGPCTADSLKMLMRKLGVKLRL
jgi:hypothetical protein